jgi:hypothetical protein
LHLKQCIKKAEVASCKKAAEDSFGMGEVASILSQAFNTSEKPVELTAKACREEW